ncbi:MAG UNVERIFIED_CONTAM: hypothetical protein LVQ98_03700 [Rickettsiaceae bacterium]|jgi:3-hydroxypropanoate dehydrogenase
MSAHVQIFKKTEVSLALLQEIYDTVKLGPTSANSSPLRIKFITSSAAKEKALTIGYGW